MSPAKGRGRPQPGLRYLPTQLRTPAPVRGPSRPTLCRLRPVPATAERGGDNGSHPEVLGHTAPRDGCPGAVPEPLRARGGPGGSRRPWDSSAGAALGGASGASPVLRIRRRGRARPGLHTAAPLRSRPSGSPGGLLEPRGGLLLPERRRCGSMIEVWGSLTGVAAGTGDECMGAEGSVWQGWKVLVFRDVVSGHVSLGWEGN